LLAVDQVTWKVWISSPTALWYLNYLGNLQGGGQCLFMTSRKLKFATPLLMI